MSDETDNPDHEPEPELDDADLASLLADHNETENVERMAELIATFYLGIRARIDPMLTSSGDVHDAALELTREWMTYTVGGEL